MKRLSNRVLALSILLPAVLIILLSSGMAVHQLKRETAITAGILMKQIDRVTGIARHATRITAEMADRPCDEILEKMTSVGALPYIRNTGLIRDDNLVCSSVTGAKIRNASELYGTRLSTGGGGVRIFSLSGTTSVPGQQAVIYAADAGHGMTAFSVVDARHFTDLMNALDNETHAALQLQFSGGPVISGQKKISAHSPAFRAAFHSPYSQAHLLVQTPVRSLLHPGLRNILFLGPLSLLLTLIALYVWRHWHSKKLSLADEIRKGMDAGAFSVHYQPICETATGKCAGAEALIRWQQKDGSFISPDVFIRAAEEHGMIISLTRHLFTLIAEDVSHWKVTTPFHLSVNIAAAHLADEAFTKDVLRLWVTLASSLNLVLEITERSLVEDADRASEKLNELRQRGCKVAVDDFGTGYCSLSLLQRLPVDYLKIDKSFIDTLSSAGTDTPILDTIVGLSKRLGLTTIAEGVSTTCQADWLRENDVPYAQGFRYARPMPSPTFYQWYSR
ncbi:cyclic diguanylate phosphodiesterase [Lelliottia sp. WAP21]|uniref:EAL domain-containing protein n=1 Tax=Lelliottia sp. WAP21 TaxID=2877426 RepID=UPI001E390B41|nr:cyclic diguanylate phosphodiesterase [Lelliottia sp. WAP21]